MRNVHLLIDFVLIIFCISIVKDHYKNLSRNDVITCFNIKLNYSWLVKSVLFLSYLFGVYSSISMFKNDSFSSTRILDILLLVAIVTSVYLTLPNKIILCEEGILYTHKLFKWSYIHNIDIYGNKVDILFNDFNRKFIELDKISLNQEKNILQICYDHNAII